MYSILFFQSKGDKTRRKKKTIRPNQVPSCSCDAQWSNNRHFKVGVCKERDILHRRNNNRVHLTSAITTGTSWNRTNYCHCTSFFVLSLFLFFCPPLIVLESLRCRVLTRSSGALQLRSLVEKKEDRSFLLLKKSVWNWMREGNTESWNLCEDWWGSLWENREFGWERSVSEKVNRKESSTSIQKHEYRCIDELLVSVALCSHTNVDFIAKLYIFLELIDQLNIEYYLSHLPCFD